MRRIGIMMVALLAVSSVSYGGICGGGGSGFLGGLFGGGCGGGSSSAGYSGASYVGAGTSCYSGSYASAPTPVVVGYGEGLFARAKARKAARQAALMASFTPLPTYGFSPVYAQPQRVSAGECINGFCPAPASIVAPAPPPPSLVPEKGSVSIVPDVGKIVVASNVDYKFYDDPAPSLVPDVPREQGNPRMIAQTGGGVTVALNDNPGGLY